jgi:hypothetical protein
MEQFKAGTTYQTRSVCDHDCIISFTVVIRTAKSIKVAAKTDTLNGKTLRIKPTYDGAAEYVKPWGSYSMAPIMTAQDCAPIAA